MTQPLKDDWEDGDVFTADDANDVAEAINNLTFGAIDGGSPESSGTESIDGGTP